MAGASPATTMIRMRRLAKAYHGSGTPCGCHVSPTYSPPSRIRQQSPATAGEEKEKAARTPRAPAGAHHPPDGVCVPLHPLLKSYRKDTNHYFTSDGDRGDRKFMMQVYISYDKLSTFLRIVGVLQVIKGMVYGLVGAHGSKAVQIACIMHRNFFAAEVKRCGVIPIGDNWDNWDSWDRVPNNDI